MEAAGVAQLAEAIAQVGDGLLTVVTGAGISLASGIPTFRGSDPGAVWAHDVTTMGTFAFFRSDPVESWRWYLHRFDAVLDKQPNPSHHALVRLERWRAQAQQPFLLVTQNIDDLHAKAGSEALVQVHGSAARVRCVREGCASAEPAGSLARTDVADAITAFRAQPTRASVPRCPQCGDLLRQHVLWFDEYYQSHTDYQWSRVQDAALRSALVVFVGTSFSVGVTDMFLRAALTVGVPVYAIDPGAHQPPHPDIRLLSAPAEDLLPAVCDRLGCPNLDA
ncbi:MAG: Sir2 family NAD-dependent protein deacetylase [Acidobacteriota bacterium]